MADFTYDNAIAREAQTGSSRMCPTGYRTPAAIGSAVVLYTRAHSWSLKVSYPLLHLLEPTRTKLSFTRRNTVADRSTRVRMPLRSDETSTNEALESATSLPDPIATATSAAARAYVKSNFHQGRHGFRTHRCIIDTISNHGDYTTIVQPSP
jgi:hypothetical protein